MPRLPLGLFRLFLHILANALQKRNRILETVSRFSISNRCQFLRNQCDKYLLSASSLYAILMYFAIITKNIAGNAKSVHSSPSVHTSLKFLHSLSERRY